MEAAEFFARDPRPTPPVGDHAATEAQVIQFPPRHGEGFLSKEGPLPYEVEIADWSTPKDTFEKGVGLVQTSVVQLSDGARYVFRKTSPTELRWETSVDYTLPLATRVTGYNTYLARKLAQSGMQSRIVGTNQAHKFSLLHDAQAALHILQQDDLQNPTAIEDESLVIGYSMGTMKALGLLGLASHMPREIKATIGLDPCLADRVDYAKQVDELPELIKYLGREIVEVSMLMCKSLPSLTPLQSLSRARHFVSTMGVSPAYLKNVYDKWKVLASGETGGFPERIPTDAAIVLHFFKACRFNDAARFKNLFPQDTYPNVRIVEEDGYHLSGASSRVVQRVVKKVNVAQHLLAEGVPASEIVNHLDTPVLKD